MEPFHPEAPEASNAEAEERRRKRDKERLLRRLRRWRKERQATTAAPQSTEASPPRASHEREAQPDPDESKGKLFGRLLKFALRRPAVERGEAPMEAAEVSPRNRWIRRITHRALDRVVETHDEVRAVVQEEKKPSKELKEDEATLQTVELELRKVSDQFEDALAKEGARAEHFQGPPDIEDATGSPKKPEPVQYSQAASEMPVPYRYPEETPGADEVTEISQQQPLPEAPVRHLSAAEAIRPTRAERPQLGNTVIKATAASIATGVGLGMAGGLGAPRGEARPIAEQAAAMRAQAEQLKRTQQTLDRLQHEKVDMYDAQQRHQRVQETVSMARSQTEVVNQATQTLQAERPASAPATSPEQQFVVPKPPSVERAPGLPQPEPAVEAPAPQTFYEQTPVQPDTTERYHVPPLAAAERSPVGPKSKEAPTERELSDRAERDPGRNWKADPQDNQTQTGDYQYADSPTQDVQLPGAYDVHAARQSDHHHRTSRQQPSKGWLLIAVLVIIIAGLMMLSLSL